MKEKIRRILPYIIAAIGLYLFLIVMVSLFFLDRYEREKNSISKNGSRPHRLKSKR